MERLTGSLQHYAWGDTEAIARLQGREPSGEPEAELWFGAHPAGPSRLSDGRSLADVIDDLPYLLKILAAAGPLSIQAHPDRARARAGFAREEAAGTTGQRRSYPDDNHKPELICAVTDFTAKCGFRPRAETVELFDALATGGPLAKVGERFRANGDDAAVLADVLGWLLRLNDAERVAIVADTAAAAARALERGRGPFEEELAWTATLARIHPGDIGVTVALLLNHVVLAPGQAMFLPAGVLHAYLGGVGVELMASSDNVIRGGLTVKHVDVDELLAIVDTTPGPPPIQTASGSEHRYDTPVPELAMTRLAGTGAWSAEPAGPEILLVTEGAITVETERLGPGEALLVPAATGRYRIEAAGFSVAWRATLGA